MEERIKELEQENEELKILIGLLGSDINNWKSVCKQYEELNERLISEKNKIISEKRELEDRIFMLNGDIGRFVEKNKDFMKELNKFKRKALKLMK